jgi:hypothetical protein
MQRRFHYERQNASADNYRLAPAMRYSLALALAVPLMAMLLLSPAGPALLRSLAAVALAVFGL